MKQIAWYAVAFGTVAALGGTQCTPHPASTAPVSCGAGRTCRSGRCAVSVPPLALPVGASVTIDEEPAPASLSTEVLQPFVCVLTMPTAPALAPVRLSVYAAGAPPKAMLFRNDATQPVGIGSTVVHGPLVEALVLTTGAYGLTERPGDWAIETTTSNDPLSSADTSELVRNVSLQAISAAYYDGTRLYVGNGPRVLIYNGVPSSPAVKPVRVLGQPELDTIVAGTTASILGSISAIWSDGTKLVVADNNRVLVWNSIPPVDFTPADLVLGQQDFVSTPANIGGVSASTMASPRGVESDGTRLLVADTLNHRVLVWSAFPTSIGQPATSVLGQPSFATADWGAFYQPGGALLDGAGAFIARGFTGSGHYASLATNSASDYAPIDPSYPLRVRREGLMWASSVAMLPGGGLAMSDPYCGRVGVHRTKPTTETSFDFVVGQPDPQRAVRSAVSGSTVNPNAKVIAANGLVLVPDGSRLLVYEGAPTFNFEPAARVVGQAGFTVNDRGTDYRRISERTLAYPSDVSVRGALVAVADRGNNRVVLFPAGDAPATNRAAAVVLGQTSATSFIPNVDQVSASASTLSGPSGVVLDGTQLIVADSENHRVLVWRPVPTSSITPATFVLGQSDFAGHRPNRGRGDADNDGASDAAADGMFYPTGVASDGTRLFVADRMNHRVLVWSDLATIATGTPADAVLGQGDFTSHRANRGDVFTPRLDGLNLPTGVTLDGTTLWVSDTENNRLVRYDDALTTPIAAGVLGQPTANALTNANYADPSSPNVGVALPQLTASSSILRPRSVSAVGQALYVSETDSNRVHIFERDLSGAYVPRGQLGQTSDATSTLNANGISAASMATPQGLASSGGRLFVADSANHRVVAFDVTAPPASGASASVVIGQASFVANGFDQAVATSAGGATRPRGMALSKGELLVAEASRHRILVHELPLVPGKLPKRIIGQPDLSVALPNAGAAPSASTLSSPRGVFADDAHILVADAANHRVLVYPREGSAATLVLGQASFAEITTNRGGAANAGTLSAPEGVFTDGTRLIVADTGNHRVLVWNAFPTVNGQPADIVIGQSSFAGTLTNRGTAVASGATLAGPSSVHVASGALFIADAGNNRVLVYDAIPGVSGATAAKILGQPSASTRVPTADINADDRLAGPVALASDGANLYVADRDGNRVLAFALEGLVTGARASGVFNANSGLIATGPAGIAVERTAFFTSRLFIADTNKDQLLVVGGVSRLR